MRKRGATSPVFEKELLVALVPTSPPSGLLRRRSRNANPLRLSGVVRLPSTTALAALSKRSGADGTRQPSRPASAGVLREADGFLAQSLVRGGLLTTGGCYVNGGSFDCAFIFPPRMQPCHGGWHSFCGVDKIIMSRYLETVDSNINSYKVSKKPFCFLRTA